MSLEHILLGMLQKPASGYDLKLDFEAGARHFWSAELSQIYPTLKRMEKRGWLESSVEYSPKGPDRRVYRRTRAGAEELRQWLRSDPAMGTERYAFIGQLIFMGELRDAGATLNFLTRLRDFFGRKLDLLESAEAEMAEQYPGYPDDLEPTAFHEHLSLRLGISSLRARVRECEKCIEKVKVRMAKEVAHV